MNFDEIETLKEKWDQCISFLEDILNPNPPKEENKFKDALLLFMLNTLQDYSHYYEGITEAEYSNLQDDTNVSQEKKEYFNKLHNQWKNLEQAFRNIDTIIKDLQSNKDILR